MNLSPELNRLVALKSLLDLGDMDLVAAAALRLESRREEPEIARFKNDFDRGWHTTDIHESSAPEYVRAIILDG